MFVGLPEPAKDPKSAGVASYIIQEEFDRYSGYWWQPSSTESGRKKVHRILYEEVDESEVELMHINHQGFDESTDYFRYPRAGELCSTNFSKLKMMISKVVILICLWLANITFNAEVLR